MSYCLLCRLETAARKEKAAAAALDIFLCLVVGPHRQEETIKLLLLRQALHDGAAAATCTFDQVKRLPQQQRLQAKPLYAFYRRAMHRLQQLLQQKEQLDTAAATDTLALQTRSTSHPGQLQQLEQPLETSQLDS